MKRTLSLLLVLSMLCIGATAYATEFEGYTLPLADPADGVTLNCWGFPLLDWKVDDLDKNQFTQWLYEKTGIKIVWTMGPATDRDSKLNLLLASGDYPEIIFNTPFDASQQQIYGDMGIILPLNDLIDKYGVETLRVFEETPEIKTALLRTDGKIYCLPQYMNSPHDESYSRMWVYKPWLDALNLSVPTTTDEFYDMLVAFRDRDPNGNGIADEIALMGATNVWFSDPFTYLINSFIYFDNNSMLDVDKGTIYPTFTQEAYREALRYIHKLYAEGLLLPQTFSQNDQAMRQLLSTGPATVGAFFAHAPFVYCDEPVYRDLVALTPLKGPEGVQYACQYYITNTSGTVITDKAKDPELAFKFLDFLYNTDATTRKSQGPQGVAWDWNTDKTLVNAYGVTPTWVTLQDEQVPNDRWALLGHHYQPLERSGLYVMDMSPSAIAERESDSGKVDGYVQIQQAAMEKYIGFFPPAEVRMPQVFLFNEDDTATVADLKLAINNKVREMQTAFVVGSASLDDDWDRYLEDLNILGLEEMISLYQQAYDAQYK